MASQSATTTPTAEVPWPQNKKIFVDWWPPDGGRRKNFGKGDVNPQRKTIFGKKMMMEKKLMSGEYDSLNEMATDLNGGNPSKDIEQIIFENMMKIMLKEFNA